MKKTAYLYVLDTMADWESAFLTAELHSMRYFKKGAPEFCIQTVGLGKDPITTMGGIRIIPDMAVTEITTDNCGLLILPGGDTWLEPMHDPILDKALELLEYNIPIAAICGATMGLAQKGMLDHCNHTSNDLNYLKAICPNYKGEEFYQRKDAVVAGNLITASGVAPLEFSRCVLEHLDVFSPLTLKAWYELYKTKEPESFYALMKSLGTE